MAKGMNALQKAKQKAAKAVEIAAKQAQETSQRLAERVADAAESSLPKFEIIEEISVIEKEEILETKRYALDNRRGSADVVSTEEISKSIKSELTIEDSHLRQAGINIAGLKVVGIQISGNVSRTTSRRVGEEITRCQSLTFKAAPESYTVYIVTWTQKVREGIYIVNVNGKQAEIPYRVVTDLSYEVTSERRD